MKYFDEAYRRYTTEFWINNPTGDDIKRSLSLGALGFTSNPCYPMVLQKSESSYFTNILSESIHDTIDKDDYESMAMAVIRRGIARPLRAFLPLYKNSSGKYGYVAIQGNPIHNHDVDYMLSEGEALHALGENVIIKVPATVEGAKAMEEMTARGWATIGTICFTVSQYVLMAEAHRRGLKRTNTKPRCLVAMFTGALDRYLDERMKQDHKLTISPEAVSFSGIHVTKRAIEICKKRNYEAKILSAGIRKPLHWLELLGPGHDAMTIDKSVAESIANQTPELQNKVGVPVSCELVRELNDKCPEFIKAHTDVGLPVDEIPTYGPYAYIQDRFVECFHQLMNEIKTRI